MQILQPLTVGNIRFAPRHILNMTCVDQEDTESLRAQDLKKWDPINPRRFHRYRLDVAAFQPSCCRTQVFRKGRKTTHRLWISVHRNGDVDFGRAYIHTGSIWVQVVQYWRTCLPLVLPSSRHDSPSIEIDVPCETAQTVQH